MVTFAACGHTTNRTSRTAEEAGTSAGTSAGTLGIITYISHDPPELCAAFMSYYIGTQRIKPSDVFVIEVDAIPEDAIRSCYERAKLPAANIHRPKPNRAHQWNEGYRIEMFHRFERLLLRRLRYTHVLIVDLDEFVLPSPQYGGQIYDYLQQSPYAQRGIVAPTSYIVMHAPSLGERDALEWATPGAALLADRRVWVRNCGGSKPVLLKHDPVKYTFSTHRVAQLPWYDPFQCLTNPRMAVRDCIDPALLSVHLKCVDSTLFKAAPLALRKAWENDKHQAPYVTRFFNGTYCGKADRWARYAVGAECRRGLRADQRPLPARCSRAFDATAQQRDVWARPGVPEFFRFTKQGHIELIPEWVRRGLVVR